jgi:hypothetical protein
MTIKETLAKIAKGEALTDEEKSSLAAYDPEKAVNDAAAAARRKAEEQAAAFKKQLDEFQSSTAAQAAAMEEEKKAKMTEAQKREAFLADLQKKVEGLEKAKADAERQTKAIQRSQAIRDAAKAAGIALAPKTVSEKLFFQMLESTLDGVDVAQEEQLKAALEGFKAENAGVILAPGSGTGGDPGKPAGPVGLDGKPVEKMTAQERESDLKKRGIV